jgi:tRNA pseudouridine55 synthase
MTRPSPSGLLVLDKPGGVTSHDVVNRVRRAFGVKRVGHAGTLDPMATGVLVVCVGEATRAIELLETEPKEYVAGVRFGVSTDTQDMTGRVTSERGSRGLTRAALEAALEGFRGERMQAPPMVSAVHHEGKRLYELARRGVEVERNARPIVVHRLEALGFEPGDRASCTLRIVCSAGTYVRTLAHDLGEALGCGGALTSLRRIRVGRYGLDRACSPAELEDDAFRARALVPLAEALAHLPAVVADDAALDRLAHGQPLDLVVDWPTGAIGAVLNPQGAVVAVARRVDGRLQPIKVFAAALEASGRSTQAR